MKHSEHGGVTLTEAQRLAWLRLIRSENVGPATFRSLINHFGSAQAALDGLPELSKRGGAGRTLRIATAGEAERELELANRIGARLVGLGEPDYPSWLRHADSPPPILMVRGATSVLSSPAVAIVGARNASVAGRKMAAILAAGLGSAGLAVVSGLARGIDSAAHDAALATGTVAVFAGGVDRIYPPENQPLLDAILANCGCAVSEMPMGWEPRARDFPRRNRIIAGMAVAAVIVEAAERSGSLITARLALEQNREVMAVPGSPLDPRAAGSNRLLKQGARLVTEARDIIDAITPMLAQPPPPLPQPGLAELVAGEPDAPPESDRGRIYEALGPTPVEVDEIIRFTQLPARIVQMVLLEFELAGRVERHPGQRVSTR